MGKHQSKKYIPFLTISGILVVILLVCVAIHFSGGRSGSPVGGTICEGDLKSNYDLYVAEECSGDTYDQAIWHVTDNDVKQDIYELCLDITQYREVVAVWDIMLGGEANTIQLPRIFFVGKSIGYKVYILNWENYSGEEWASFPIKNEAFGEPIIWLWRIDLKECPEGISKLDYVKSYGRRDSLNNEGGLGWYSTMPLSEFEALLVLLGQVDGRCAEAAS